MMQARSLGCILGPDDVYDFSPARKRPFARMLAEALSTKDDEKMATAWEIAEHLIPELLSVASENSEEILMEMEESQVMEGVEHVRF